VCTSDFSFLCLSETWLSSDVSDSELFPNYMKVYRADRNFAACGKTRGGGVIFAHNINIKSVAIPLEGFNFPHVIDIVSVSVLYNTGSISVIVLYIPPDVNQITYDACIESLVFLLSSLKTRATFLVGDFNTPHFENPIDARSRTLSSLPDFCGLYQANTIRNVSNRLLDLIFINTECTISRCESPLVAEDPLHPALVANISFPIADTTFRSNSNNIRFDFKNADLPNLYASIATTNWECLLDCADSNSMCDLFYSLLMSSIDIYVPKSRRRAASAPIWHTLELSKLIKAKERARRKFSRLKSEESYSDFSNLRSQVKSLSVITYKNFIAHAENLINSDPKYFWKFVNSKRSSSRIPGEMYLNNSSLNDPQSIVDGFAKYFAKVYLPPSSVDISPNVQFEDGSISLLDFSEDEIIKACKMLTPNFTSGFDMLPAFLVSDCAHILAKPLSYLFNKSLQLQTFPERWKITNICPIFKSGDKSDISNYRPISIISNFSKILEKCIINRLLLQILPKISIHQHGFVKNRSTTTNLVCITQYISDAMDKGGQVDVLYTDLAKAFDRVDTGILLQKVKAFGFSFQLVNFFKSYLTSRSCFVTYNGFSSLPFIPSSGVPQGSILGPMLFLVFINDLADSLDCLKLLFADDLKMFASINTKTDCQRLQGQLQVLEEWCSRNKLEINVSKCRVVSFTKRKKPVHFNYILNNCIIQKTDNFTDLGVIFDCKLRFNLHIESKIKAASKMLGFIIRSSRDMNNTDSIMLLYTSYVRSILEYASTIWSPYYECYTKSLESVQRKFLKFLFWKKHKKYPPRGYPHNELCSEFNVPTLELRRKFSDIKFLNKLLNNVINLDRFYINITLASSRLSSRYKKLFATPRANTNVLVNSPSVRLAELGNRCATVINICVLSPGELSRLISTGTLDFI